MQLTLYTKRSGLDSLILQKLPEIEKNPVFREKNPVFREKRIDYFIWEVYNICEKKGGDTP